MKRTERALITGASSGIGTDLARVFAEDGWQLVLNGRDESRLRSLAEELTEKHRTSVKTLPQDLAIPGAASRIYTELHNQSLPISCLVNNAGFGLAGVFAENDLRKYVDMVQVNVTALVELTHLFLQPMRARKSGKILNVASTAAFQPGPCMAMYYASKAFVFSFSYALAEELSGSGVTVTTLCPGPTRTAFFERAGMRRSLKFMNKWSADSRQVADLGYQAMIKGKRVIIPGFVNKLGVMLSRRSPIFLTAKVAKKLSQI